jgi:quercetin dioxygenase-like cupin family protein
MTPPIWNEPPQGRTLAVVGDVYRFLATGADTNGQFALWEAIVAPGAGPPPHIHTREVESFYVLEGEVTFTLESGKRVAGPGTFVGIPIGTLHGFGNDTDKPARMLIQVAPAGLEEMFFQCGRELPEGTTACDPPTEEEINSLLEIAPEWGIDIRK